MLAGGRSRRLGGIAKGLEVVGGRRIIDRVADALRAVTTELALAANDPAAADWLAGVPVLPDAHAGAGGLAGIESALTQGRDIVVVAWDMPFVTGELLREMLVVAQSEDADAVVAASNSPHGFEPFCAFYSARIATVLTRFLDGGGGAAHQFVARIPRARVLAAKQLAAIGDPERLFFSVNTDADLARARAMAGDSE